jgi:hypothetical protein
MSDSAASSVFGASKSSDVQPCGYQSFVWWGLFGDGWYNLWPHHCSIIHPCVGSGSLSLMCPDFRDGLYEGEVVHFRCQWYEGGVLMSDCDPVIPP